MNRRLLYGIIFILFFQLSVVDSFSQLTYQGNNYLEWSIDRENDKQYFEDWAEFFLGYKDFRAGLRFEAHEPPQPYSPDTTGYGIAQRFLEYRKSYFTATLGNYYTLFGRGLVLRSFENRMIRWDTNIDGGKVDFNHPLLDAEVIAGRPRDRSGRRQEWLEGGYLKFKPISLLDIGGTFVTTDLKDKGRVYWGSVLADLNFDWGEFYFERAFKDFPSQYPKGKAYYLMGNIYYGNATLLVEYRDYDQFDITEGLTYNNPPTVFREHLYTLLNRYQRVQDARDERGYQVEFTYGIGDNTVLTLNNNRTTNHNGLVLYREYYGQLEFDPSDYWSLVGGAGQQENLEARYLNFVGTAKWIISDYHAIKAIVEHQHAKILLNDRQYYDQALTLAYDIFSRVTLSLISERTTDQLSEEDYWIAGQVDVHLPKNFDLTVFGGNRRKGKICAGGVCINRPAFEGIEIRLLNRF